MKPISLLLPVLIAALRNCHTQYFIAKKIALKNDPEIIFDDALLTDHTSGCLLKNNMIAANTEGCKIFVKSHAHYIFQYYLIAIITKIQQLYECSILYLSNISMEDSRSLAWVNTKATKLLYKLKSSTVGCYFNCVAVIQLKNMKMSLYIK